ncbi:hypothetical protein FPOAC2_11442 [Fusarium poae]|uniref:hypothetical protein n=1 Tax=Fusarium poae TaxID=36050 RepID=UPI001CEA00D4|nr:hypothetical protein FPOAC1_011138 [Fusarium poae]KAG8666334.1 hypothetical protein FPOAC1_011138 [Fusarium poae]
MRPLPPPSWMPRGYYGKIPRIITSIRELPSGVAPTLDNIPEINHTMIGTEPLSSLIWGMQETDFKRWGFVIFRTVYTEESQPLWESYIEFLKVSVEEYLESKELSTLLNPLLEWVIIEDQQTLNNAPKQHVRERFSAWVSQHFVERDGPEVPDAFRRQQFPRFRYCIYVDQKCLDTVAQYEAWAKAGAEGVGKQVVCVVLDKNCHRKGEGKGRFPRIEGCSREYTGWQYISVHCLAGLYDKLSKQELSGYDYTRPPMVFPSDGPMPID